MKKTLLLILLVSSLVTYAQVDLSGYYGYQFGSKTYTYDGTVRLKSSDNWGAMLEFGVAPDLMIQLGYSNTQSSSTLERSVVVAESDIGVSYYQIGVIRPVPVNQKVDFFGNFTMGMTQYNFKNDIYNDQYFFSIVLGLGTKIWLNDVVGLRLQARLLAPINWAGLSFYCGTGGCGTGASASSTLISGDVGAGLILRLKK